MISDKVNRIYILAYGIPTNLNGISTIILVCGLYKIRKFMKMHSGTSNESRYCLHLLLFLVLNVIEAYIYVSIIFANNDVKYATTRFNTMSILYNLVNFIVTCFILWLLWQFSKKNWTRRVEDSLSSDRGSDNPSQRSQRISEGPNSRPQRENEDPSRRSQSEGDDHSESPQSSSQVGEGERED